MQSFCNVRSDGMMKISKRVVFSGWLNGSCFGVPGVTPARNCVVKSSRNDWFQKERKR